MFDRGASLIDVGLTDFYQKLVDGSTQPMGGYFPKNVAIYLVSDCHNLAPVEYSWIVLLGVTFSILQHFENIRRK
jgi:hypothetical protein